MEEKCMFGKMHVIGILLKSVIDWSRWLLNPPKCPKQEKG